MEHLKEILQKQHMHPFGADSLYKGFFKYLSLNCTMTGMHVKAPSG